jgi:hypothetical protein
MNRLYLAVCESCWHVFATGNRLADIPDLSMRLAPGDRVPAAECPECKALAYPSCAWEEVSIYFTSGCTCRPIKANGTILVANDEDCPVHGLQAVYGHQLFDWLAGISADGAGGQR